MCGPLDRAVSENRLGQTKRASQRLAFQPGNPGGRPAVAKDIGEIARQHTADAVGVSVSIEQFLRVGVQNFQLVGPVSAVFALFGT